MTIRSRLASFCWLALLGVVSGCSQDDAAPTRAPDSNLVTVTGVVIRIVDQVPADGGVLLDVRVAGGAVQKAYMPSLFTAPPPPPEQHELYEVIRTLEVGNRIRVEGERTNDGIKMSKLTRIE